MAASICWILTPIGTPHQRLMVLKDLGLAAQIVSATLALGFDQVENAIRLGDEGLFLHSRRPGDSDC